tara:strand:+ start:328 stop:531 length:204 start_codon:yes stop_codon:yes gene_type:complete
MYIEETAAGLDLCRRTIYVNVKIIPWLKTESGHTHQNSVLVGTRSILTLKRIMINDSLAHVIRGKRA